MRVPRDLKKDIKRAKKIRLPWWALLCLGIGVLPIYWLFDHFGKLELALPTLNCVGVFGFAIDVKWELRARVWFWITMAIIGALHVLLILFVPWTTNWVPAMTIAGIDSLDFVAILAILFVVGRLMEEPQTAER